MLVRPSDTSGTTIMQVTKRDRLWIETLSVYVYVYILERAKLWQQLNARNACTARDWRGSRVNQLYKVLLAQ
jgi:hypothetical protein